MQLARNRSTSECATYCAISFTHHRQSSLVPPPSSRSRSVSARLPHIQTQPVREHGVGVATVEPGRIILPHRLQEGAVLGHERIVSGAAGRVHRNADRRYPRPSHRLGSRCRRCGDHECYGGNDFGDRGRIAGGHAPYPLPPLGRWNRREATGRRSEHAAGRLDDGGATFSSCLHRVNAAGARGALCAARRSRAGAQFGTMRARGCSWRSR